MKPPCQSVAVPRSRSGASGLPVPLVGGNSGRIVGFAGFGADFGALSRLRLAAFEVFPQGRLEPRFAPLFLGEFGPFRHGR